MYRPVVNGLTDNNIEKNSERSIRFVLIVNIAYNEMEESENIIRYKRFPSTQR